MEMEHPVWRPMTGEAERRLKWKKEPQEKTERQHEGGCERIIEDRSMQDGMTKAGPLLHREGL